MPPISPPPLLEEQADFLPAYLSNGVIGLRVPPIPLAGGIAILNGFAGVDPDSGAEAVAQAPYPLAGTIVVNGRSLTRAPECAVLREQRYDFGSGELHTTFDYQGPDARASVEMLTFCSRSLPMLVLQELVVTVDRACDLAVAGGVDPIGIPGTWQQRRTRTRGSENESVDGSIRWCSHGGLASCGAAYVTMLSGADAERGVEHNELRPLETRYAFRARKGRRYRFRQIAALVSETMHSQPDLQAVRLLHAGERRGFDGLREDNRAIWDELWRARVVLHGASSRWQELADAAFFYLHTSVHPSSPTSTGIFGLAYWPNYHYYRGHVMWDLETFVVPPLVLTAPDAARTLLEYRADRVRAARLNAAMNGYRGAQFPWEGSLLVGEETAPGDGTASAHEHHVSLDVAFAVSQFLHATNDWNWGRERAWRLLHDVAEWAESRGLETERGFEIHDVNGIAERQEAVDNNAFVNMAAAVAFREAAALAPLLGHEPIPRWDQLSRSVFLPVGPDGVVRNHDRYRPDEEKGETPEAAAGLFPFTYEVPPEVERATFAFYLGLADRYVGAPMLSALLGVYAARLGDRARSLEFFERGYAEFVIDPFTMTAEYHPRVFPDQEAAAPFAANTGGFLMSCLYGLPGLRLGEGEPETWCTRPVTLPAGWDAIEIERLWVRGRRARLTAEHGAERAALVLEA